MADGDNVSALPILAFLILAFILALASAGSDGEPRPLISFEERDGEEEHVAEEPNRERQTFISAPQERPDSATPQEIERELQNAMRELDQLRTETRTARIWGDVSPYEGMVQLNKGDVRTEDSEEEYLRLNARGSNDEAINISGWLIESYVTGDGATIPFGARFYRGGRVNDTQAIFLEPGERAYVLTDESPVGVSFHENKCTGYLEEYQDFLPSLTRSCPRPLDELERFGGVNLNDDACYEFLEDIRTCTIPNDSELDTFFIIEESEDDDEEDEIVRLSGACKRFVWTTLDYNSCFEKHGSEPLFDKGEWYIYLGRSDALWRKEREIIRLIDRQGRTVDVIEY